MYLNLKIVAFSSDFKVRNRFHGIFYQTCFWDTSMLVTKFRQAFVSNIQRSSPSLQLSSLKTVKSCNGKKSTLDLKWNRVLGEWKCIVRSVFDNSPILESKKIEDHFIDCGKNHRFCASVRIKLFDLNIILKFIYFNTINLTQFN